MINTTLDNRIVNIKEYIIFGWFKVNGFRRFQLKLTLFSFVGNGVGKHFEVFPEGGQGCAEGPCPSQCTLKAFEDFSCRILTAAWPS